MPAQLSEFAERFLSKESRSTALRPLGWLIALSSTAGISSFRFGCPGWVGSIFAGLSFLSIVTYIIAYIYFAFTDKDALRSETFYIQKLAIERGLIGDDLVGYKETVEVLPLPDQQALIPAEENQSDQRDNK